MIELPVVGEEKGNPRMKRLAIIGGGPAGLRAAEIASAAGLQVTLYDGKRSVGRKFLVAGKGGFNLTHAEPLEDFVTRYRGPDQASQFWEGALATFDNAEMRGWAARLGTGTFVASSGRVYPKALKAAPLLRAWIKRLKEQEVAFEMNHRLVGIERSFDKIELQFEVLGAAQSVVADAVVLALGGGSWPQTGSDGQWTEFLGKAGVAIDPLTAANCGWEVAWSAPLLAAHEGAALKNLVVSAGEESAKGELILTRYGLEGGPLYQLGPAIRGQAPAVVEIDFKPTLTLARMVAKMESAKRNLLVEARLRWKLCEATCAILAQWHGPFDSAESLAHAAKHCRIPLTHPRPLAEAISSAGGVAWQELDEGLMLRKIPGVFLAGEMISWEAPTGGYLMQGCFATGTLAGQSASAWLRGQSGGDS